MTMTRIEVPAGAATVADWERINEQDSGHRWELDGGGLRMMAPPKAWHDIVVGRIVTWLIRSGGAIDDRVLIAPGLVTDAEHARIPDVVLLRQRWSGQATLNPRDVLLVVEVESPSTAYADQGVKLDEYARAGVPRYWRVTGAEDPDTARVTGYVLSTPGAKAYLLAANLPLVDVLGGSMERAGLE